MSVEVKINSISNSDLWNINRGRKKEICPSLDDYDGYDDECESYQDYDVYAGNTRRSFAVNRLAYN